MKKIISLVLTVCLVLSLGMTVSAERIVNVTLGGEKLIADVAPKVISGRILLPLRAVFEAIGATVGYDAATQKVTATKDGTTVELVIGSDIMYINGVEKKLDVAPVAENNRTLVPLRACAEAFDLKIDWNNPTYTAKVRAEATVLKKCTYPDGSFEEYEYDANGNNTLISSEVTINGKQEKNWIKYIYDENDNAVLMCSNNYTETKYEYDTNGALVREVSAYGTLEHVNDAEGKRIKEQLYDGSYTEYTYDARGNVASAKTGDYVVNYLYDDYCRQTYRGNEDGSYWEKLTYTESGELSTKEVSTGAWEKYEYDEKGRQTSFSTNTGYWEKTVYEDNSSTTTTSNDTTTITTYDDNGNILKKDYGIKWEEYEYDDKGNLVKYTDDSGIIREYITIIK